MEIIHNKRIIDPFFEDAVNQIFLNPSKSFYVMDGPIGLGKSTNFLMWGSYQIAQCVQPIRKGKRMVRESLWAGIRESENSAQSTFLQLLEAAIFTPEIMALEDSPVKLYGSHPSFIAIEHELPDGTYLEMKIECHGFNNIQALNRLKSREYMGALLPEVQGIPWEIFETAAERCGRWRTASMVIEKEIDGVLHRLTGLDKLRIVMADVNIPERPHLIYEKYYDQPRKKDLPYLFITPPSPLLHVDVEKVRAKKPELLEKYRVTRFEGKEVMWFPNPKCYNMTQHFEEQDENGKLVQWTGFSLWYKELHRPDSVIRRYVKGIPDTVGGEAAIYKNFVKDDTTVLEKTLVDGCMIYVGYDPGGYAAIEMCQFLPGDRIHYFKEFIFEPVDRASTKVQFRDFFFPWCRTNLQGYNVTLVPDPASSWLGKNVMMGHTESVVNNITDALAAELAEHPESRIKYSIEPCLVTNQDTVARIGSLQAFMDKGTLTADPDCEGLIAALGGGYQRKKLKSGLISDSIDKDNPHSHPAEAAQYPAVNILNVMGRARDGRQNSKKRGSYTVKRTRK